MGNHVSEPYLSWNLYIRSLYNIHQQTGHDPFANDDLFLDEKGGIIWKVTLIKVNIYYTLYLILLLYLLAKEEGSCKLEPKSGKMYNKKYDFLIFVMYFLLNLSFPATPSISINIWYKKLNVTFTSCVLC